MSTTLKNTAEQLADLMMKHLATLSPEEQERSIKAGQKVLKKKPKAAAASSGRYPKGSLLGGMVRSPLAARGR